MNAAFIGLKFLPGNCIVVDGAVYVMVLFEMCCKLHTLSV